MIDNCSQILGHVADGNKSQLLMQCVSLIRTIEIQVQHRQKCAALLAIIAKYGNPIRQ